MPVLEPVVLMIAEGVVAFDLWPVVSRDPVWLRLNGQMTAAEVGMAVWATFFSAGPIGDVPVPQTPAEALRLISDFDYLYVGGGLLVADQTAGITVEPGCCSDLTEWRQWLRVLDGYAVDLGHYPTPWLELLDNVVRIWIDGGHLGADGRAEEARFHGIVYDRYVDVDRAALPGLLQAARRDLVQFLDLLRIWAARIAPVEAGRFLASIDEGLQISAPLPC